MSRFPSVMAVLTAALLSLATCGNAFSIAPVSLQQAHSRAINKRQRTALHVGDMLSGIFGDKRQEGNKGTPVFEVKAKEIKVGGLRFFLNIYLVGQANTPEQATWQVLQNDEGSLDLYFKDGTGILSVTITPDSIAATRYAAKPSLQYVLQESVMCHGLLDELNTLAFEVDDIEEEKRLIRLNDPGDAIALARESLPAKPADT